MIMTQRAQMQTSARAQPAPAPPPLPQILPPSPNCDPSHQVHIRSQSHPNDKPSCTPPHPASARSIWVFTPAPAAAVLLGCYGAGAAPLERASVLRGGDAAALARAAAAGAGRFAASLMPRAVERALGDAGLAGSTLVAIGPPGAPLGALMLACRDPVVLRCDRCAARWARARGCAGIASVGGCGIGWRLRPPAFLQACSA